MRTRKIGALAIATTLLLSLGACSKSNETSTSNTTTTTAAKESTTTAKKDDSSSGGDSKDETTTTKKKSGSSSGDSDSSMPDLGNLGDCMEIGLTYAGLFLGILGGSEEDIQKIRDSIQEIKGKVPDDIKDDLDFLAENITADKSMREISEFMDSDEFKKADANINKYLEETCG